MMSMIVSQITSLMSVYSTVYSGAVQSKHQSSASQAFVRGIHRWPVNSPHNGPVTRKMLPFDDIMITQTAHVRWARVFSILMIKAQHCTVTYKPNLLDGLVQERSWWRHQMETFSALLAITAPRWIPRTKASEAELWCFLWSASE